VHRTPTQAREAGSRAVIVRAVVRAGTGAW
jgi:hypothetical protein